MKNLLIAMVAGASLWSGSAFASQTESVVINAEAAARCGISGATSATVTGTGPSGSLADSTGFLATGLQSRINQALTSTNTLAWCTALSVVNLRRTPLVRSGTDGKIDSSGFARAIGYDVAIRIAGARRVLPINVTSGPHEGTADGVFGPVMRPFGPTGAGNALTFLNDDFALVNSFNATPKVLNLTSSPNFDGFAAVLQGQAVATPTRLAAGQYTSTVTLTLTPVS